MDARDEVAADATADLDTDPDTDALPASAGVRKAAATARAQSTVDTQRSSPDILLRGRYLLEETIGEGGTSVVYRARDLRRDAAAPGGQHVAVKLLRPGLRDQPRAIERLKREFHHAQTLSHPHIARVYDVDCEGPAWFLTLELLAGETLAALLDQRSTPLPWRRALDIVRACGEALAFAHERGVVHGDFKPRNVYVMDGGQIRVLDFGSASASWLAPEAQGLTATPAYASPEVLSGQRPERRDDVFSLACVAFEVLCGRHPFDRRSALDARNSGRVAARNGKLSDRQWHALQSGLAWTREDRPATIRALLVDIASTEETAPLVLSPINAPTARFRSSHRAQFSAFAALAALAAVVLVAHWQLDDVPTVVTRTQQAARSLVGLPPVAAKPTETASRSPPDAAPEQARSITADAKDRESSTPSAPSSARAAAHAASAGTGESYLSETSALLSFDVDTVTVSEGASSAVLGINRRRQLGGRALVRWRTFAGSATPGQDFRQVTQGTAEFADGQTMRAIYVPLIDDVASEKDEVFVVELYAPEGTVRINPIARVRVTVRDNDSAGPVQVAERAVAK